MHLTRFTDLSLRVLIYLTHNERKGLVTVTELAERFKWSRNHMVKVVHFMSTKNWVQTHRGRFGRASEILCPWDNRSPPNGCIQ